MSEQQGLGIVVPHSWRAGEWSYNRRRGQERTEDRRGQRTGEDRGQERGERQRATSNCAQIRTRTVHEVAAYRPQQYNLSASANTKVLRQGEPTFSFNVFKLLRNESIEL